MNRDALVIGINRYSYLKDTQNQCGAKHLQLPAQDAEKIAKILETHGNFRVHHLPESLINGKWQIDPKKIVKTEELETDDS
ncbi:hypothetical protein WJM97_10325 [Okeanomitos corallinicola TIOX110]|uniref:Uncharacterized protein n=1 Tax=Okeanomitos corallinicola TIOX110 TaxID=3133117 RepID=A0ABZ2UX95_9CYAN